MAETEYLIMAGLFPTIAVGPRAWFFADGKWKEIQRAELAYNVAVISKERFNRTFGHLPPVPYRADAATEESAMIDLTLDPLATLIVGGLLIGICAGLVVHLFG